MKIAHVLTRLLRAGSEENTLASCKAQITAGHAVYLFHGCEFDDRYYKNPIPGLHLVEVKNLVHPLSPKSDIKAYQELVRLYKNLAIDVVHTHQSKAGIVGRLAALSAKVPLVIHGVHIVPFANVSKIQKFIYLAAEKFTAKFTHAFVDVSRGMRDIYIKEGVGSSNNHYIVHSGFEIKKFKNASPPADWREILRLSPNEEKPPVIVMLAALEPRKRHIEFLTAFVKLTKNIPNVRLIMPGEGPYKTVVESKIKELGLENNALLIGYRTDPEKIIAMADVCTLTSTREGLPRVIMQYLVTGKTCVVCDLPGLDEVVQHNMNGIVVAPNDLDGAITNLQYLLETPDELSRLTKGARDSDLESWDVEHMGQMLESIYQTHYKKLSIQ